MLIIEHKLINHVSYHFIHHYSESIRFYTNFHHKFTTNLLYILLIFQHEALKVFFFFFFYWWRHHWRHTDEGSLHKHFFLVLSCWRWKWKSWRKASLCRLHLTPWWSTHWDRCASLFIVVVYQMLFFIKSPHWQLQTSFK